MPTDLDSLARRLVKNLGARDAGALALRVIELLAKQRADSLRPEQRAALAYSVATVTELVDSLAAPASEGANESGGVTPRGESS